MAANGDSSTGPPADVPTVLVKTEGVAAGEGSSALLPAAAPTINIPPLPLRCPPFPKSGKRKAVEEWNAECRRISKLATKDPRRKFPTVIEPKDPYTADTVASSRDKALVRNAARSVVNITSIKPDGNTIHSCCTGFIVSWNGTKKCARILTSSATVHGLGDHKPKLHVRLPDNTVIDGQLLFFDEHYDIALLEISSESDLPLQLPSFGSNPNYGQEVFMLARGEESNLMARHGSILWFDGLDFLQYGGSMFLSCDLPRGGTGGPVIDHDGNVIGMAFIAPKPNILAISTILTCIEMWSRFSHIARPVHGLHLRTVELLEVSLLEAISLHHNIHSGYIVDKVDADSTAERLGIRYGDVIVSFDGLQTHTLPQLEDYLLSLGWKFLERSIDSSSLVDLTLEVYDLLGRITRNITLPVEFSDP
ncbi:hypothetical protein HU200_057903 [Digitaria exilis]|uniref:PDZ domain-containing protein n=1 Tax=Digitaria exilis TaxID=1010633 RepID=A0A835E402_9POAL|nr:hypothetical protein HU200_057903 [Digitaria exilis]